MHPYRGETTMDADLSNTSGLSMAMRHMDESTTTSSTNGGKKRPRNPLLEGTESMLEFSKAEWKELNPKLHSLLLPWALLACVAIGSTVATTKWSDLRNDNHEGLPSDFSSSLAPLLERFLNGESEADESSLHRQLLHQKHADLFPLTTSDYWGFFLATLGLMVAAGGGIGGGGILVPIYSLVHGFSPKHAIPLSNITVLGGAVANTVLNASKRHPLADRPLVDWDLILVMEPLTIAGALIGAFLNKLLPESILTVMLVVLLSFTAYSSLKSAIKMYKRETKHMREQGYRADGTKESELTKLAHSQDDAEDPEASESLLEGAELQESDDVPEEESKPKQEDEYKSDDELTEVELLETEASKKAQLEEILEEERHVPMTNIKILVVMFVVVLAVNLLKGGGAFKSPVGIVCGSKSFWLANGFVLLWIVMISLFIRAYLVNRYKIKQRVGYQYVEGDIKWNSRATIVYPCVCALAGFFAGMFGVGKSRKQRCNLNSVCCPLQTDKFVSLTLLQAVAL
jgi:uncharacterized membrane protein YfcA